MSKVLKGYYIERTCITKERYFSRKLGKFSSFLSDATIYPSEDSAADDLRILGGVLKEDLVLQPLYKEVDLEAKEVILSKFSEFIKNCEYCPFVEECEKLQETSRSYTTNSTDLCEVLKGEWEYM